MWFELQLDMELWDGHAHSRGSVDQYCYFDCEAVAVSGSPLPVDSCSEHSILFGADDMGQVWAKQTVSAVVKEKKTHLSVCKEHTK